MELDEESESPFAVIARYQKSAPVDVDAIARAFGIKVYKQSLGADTLGMLVRDRLKGGSSEYAIYVNSEGHPNRQRFTLAHELAHFVLHKDLMDTRIVDDTMYRSSLGNMYETQANKLAADILMPIMLVKSAYRTIPDPRRLAQQFQVSLAAMQIRLKGLSIAP
jgi:Zn-dependent peptidase ImmA (M78 family)